MKRNRFPILFFAFVTVILHVCFVAAGFCSAAPEAKATKGAASNKEILVKIGTKTITKADFEARLSTLPPEYQIRFQDRQRKMEFLELVVQAQLLAMEALSEKIDKDPKVAMRIDDAKTSILAQEYVNRRMAKVKSVTDAEVQKYYNDNKAEFLNPEMVKAQHILVKVEQDAKPQEDAAALAKAKEILKELNGGADFAKLAEKYSDDPGSKERGGDVGFFARDRMVPEFSAEAFRLQPGETGGPVRSQFGYHIIRTNEKKAAAQMEFGEAAPQIQAELENQKRKEALERDLERLRKKYKVMINPD